MRVNLVKLAINCFQCNVFIFESKRQTGYDINIAKYSNLRVPFRMVYLMNQRCI